MSCTGGIQGHELWCWQKPAATEKTQDSVLYVGIGTVSCCAFPGLGGQSSVVTETRVTS